jgi:hypothetical protein
VNMGPGKAKTKWWGPEDFTGTPQWEHFIQKGGQNFFLFKFLFF